MADTESGSPPPPQDPAALTAAELSARIRSVQFPRIRLHKGYDRYDVDWLLRKVADHLDKGTPRPELADELANARFSATQVRAGYDEKAVDDFVDEVVEALRGLLGPVTPTETKPSVLSSVLRRLRRG